MKLRVILTALVFVCLLGGSAFGETWDWAGSTSDMQSLSLRVDGQDKNLVLVGPIPLPNDLEGRVIFGATLEFEAEPAEGEDQGTLEVYPVESTPEALARTIDDLHVRYTTKSIRNLRASGSQRIPLEQIVRRWQANPNLPRYLVLGTLEVKDSADPTVAQRDLPEGARIHLQIRYR